MTSTPDWADEEQTWYEQLFDPTPDYEYYDFDEPEVDDEPDIVGPNFVADFKLHGTVTGRIPRRCPTTTPEPHELGEFPMTCYNCHMEADS